MVMDQVDLRNCNNLLCRVTVGDNKYIGRIETLGNKNTYLFSNDEDNTLVAIWDSQTKTFFGVNDEEVSDFAIIPRNPRTYMDWRVGDKCAKNDEDNLEVIYRYGEFVVCKDAFGYASENYTCRQLFDDGYRLILTEIEKSIIDEAADKKSKWIPNYGETVLVRDCYGDKWLLAAFITYDECCNKGNYEVTDGQASFWSSQCIPYNKETRHLLGTTKNCNQLNF